jgi:CheY-like chemotaxis protein
VICERLVDLMGGRISIDSEPGKGATLTFNIHTSVSKKAASTAFNCEGLRGRRVLLADRNPNILRIISEQLKQWQMQPICASTAEEALRHLTEANQFSMVIIGTQVPGTDTLELGPAIKNINPNIPVTLMCSVLEKGKTQGVFDKTLLKPLKRQQLWNMLQAVLLEKQPEPREKPAALLLSEQFAEKYPMNILIAEDNLINQKLITKIISKLGYHPQVAHNGKQVLEIVEKEFFDVILMDVQMPELDGLETTRILRKSEARQPYIIAMTASAMAEDRAACLDAGMNSFVSKPISIQELVTALEKTYAEKMVLVGG